MATLSVAVLQALLLVLFHAHVCVSASDFLQGSVTCLDCAPRYNLSGVLVATKCSHLKTLLPAYTDYSGHFEVEIPADSSSPVDCLARILGGSQQLYSAERSIASKVIRQRGSEHYSLATAPLTFFTSHPSGHVLHSSPDAGLAAEKVSPSSPRRVSARDAAAPPPLHVPVPGDWGLPPFIYLFPFFPIIGIP